MTPVMMTLREAEQEYVQRVFTACNGNLSRTARILGLHRRSLQRKLHSYNVHQRKIKQFGAR